MSCAVAALLFRLFQRKTLKRLVSVISCEPPFHALKNPNPRPWLTQPKLPPHPLSHVRRRWHEGPGEPALVRAEPAIISRPPHAPAAHHPARPARSQLKFTAKQLSRLSLKCTKEERVEKDKIKKALEKDNHDGARIHAQNAIRQKSNAQNYLRLSSRIDAVSSRLESAIKMQQVRSASRPLAA